MRLVTVANRLPVTVLAEGRDAKFVPSTGGLASALTRLHERTEGVWVGWPGELPKSLLGQRESIVEQLRAQRLVPIELSQTEAARYYDAFSNAVIWPLFHYLLDKVKLDAELDYKSYYNVNRRFAEAVAREVRSDDLVWVHDYQLMLVPGMLRRLVPDCRIGFFLHIPFPSSETYRTLPWRAELLESLLAADVLGFHTASYRYNFVRAAVQVLGTGSGLDEIEHEERRVRLGVYPIGIEPSAFEEAAEDREVRDEMERIQAAAPTKRIVLGVDRLDYTKGIPRRLLAVERFLELRPQWRERLHFVQIAIPTREKVAAYSELRRNVNELAGRINAHYGSPVASPIQLLYRSISFHQLVALYRLADVMLVTPLRDGMNLVAKEYVASRVNDDGVLVLSEFAGAAAELREALSVNPFDLMGTAQALDAALKMPLEEQRLRMQAMRSHVRMHDVHGWATRFIDDLAQMSSVSVHPIPREAITPTSPPLEKWRASPHRLLLLDYDGTLVRHVAMPELAAPDSELIELLTSLARMPGTEVHVISGRNRASIEPWLGTLPIGLHAEHGFWSRPRGGKWTANRLSLESWKDLLRPRLETAVRRTPGAFLEEKTVSLAFHFRRVDPTLAQDRLRTLRDELRACLPDEVEILEGSKVLELRLRGVHKGLVGSALTHAMSGEEVLAFGNDRTDEDLFASLPPNSITVRVGPGPSRARYVVPSVQDVRDLLSTLLTAEG